MSNQHPRLKVALEKVLLELNNCILKRRAYNKLLSLNTNHGLDFFRICTAALQNDIYAGAHRAFDTNPDAASFWYIRNICMDENFEKAVLDTGTTIDILKNLSNKLKPIRDRVHFHSDRRDLIDSNKPWDEADITGDDFISLTENAHEVLRILYLNLTGQDKKVPDYFGDDIANIITAYKEKFG